MGVAPETREAEILAAAAQLFASHGYTAVGIDEIAAAVGLSGPAVYRYFPNKEAILAGVVMGTVEEVTRAFEAFDDLEGEPDGEAVLLRSATMALDNRAGLATAFREAGRLPESVAGRAQEAGLRLVALSHAAVRRFNPTLDLLGVTMRALASNSTVVHVTTGQVQVPRPRLDRMVAASAVALFKAPRPAPDPAFLPGRRWRPTPTRRDVILQAALRLFRARSFHDVGVDEIAAAAEVPTRALYRQYRNKADILQEAYARADRLVAAATEMGLDDATTAEGAVDGLASRMAAFAVRHVDLAVVTSREDKALPDGRRPTFRAVDDLVDIWAQALAEARPDRPPAEVRLLATTAVPLAVDAAAVIDAHPERAPEVAALVRAHLHS